MQGKRQFIKPTETEVYKKIFINFVTMLTGSTGTGKTTQLLAILYNIIKDVRKVIYVAENSNDLPKIKQICGNKLKFLQSNRAGYSKELETEVLRVLDQYFTECEGFNGLHDTTKYYNITCEYMFRCASHICELQKNAINFLKSCDNNDSVKNYLISTLLPSGLVFVSDGIVSKINNAQPLELRNEIVSYFIKSLEVYRDSFENLLTDLQSYFKSVEISKQQFLHLQVLEAGEEDPNLKEQYEQNKLNLTLKVKGNAFYIFQHYFYAYLLCNLCTSIDQPSIILELEKKYDLDEGEQFGIGTINKLFFSSLTNFNIVVVIDDNQKLLNNTTVHKTPGVTQAEIALSNLLANKVTVWRHYPVSLIFMAQDWTKCSPLLRKMPHNTVIIDALNFGSFAKERGIKPKDDAYLACKEILGGAGSKTKPVYISSVPLGDDGSVKFLERCPPNLINSLKGGF
jgi:energy-coupling factor transporter ATP-binding protein EcfA2